MKLSSTVVSTKILAEDHFSIIKAPTLWTLDGSGVTGG